MGAVGGGRKTQIIPRNPWNAAAVGNFLLLPAAAAASSFGWDRDPEAAERLFPSLAAISPRFTSAAPSGIF